MSTAAEFREESRLYRQEAIKEADPHFKRRLASHALALAQLAERLERKETNHGAPEQHRLPISSLLTPPEAQLWLIQRPRQAR